MATVITITITITITIIIIITITCAGHSHPVGAPKLALPEDEGVRLLT